MNIRKTKILLYYLQQNIFKPQISHLLTEHSDYIRHRSILVRNNYCIIIKIRFEMTNPHTTNFDFSNRL